LNVVAKADDTRIQMTVRSILSHLVTQLFGFAIALVGIIFLYFEYRGGAEHAHTTHVILYTGIFGVGCLIIAPNLVPRAAGRLVMIVVDARKNGLRWTDKLVDEGAAIPVAKPATPVIEKPPAGAGDV
jgi:hypothetical protein